MSRLGKLIKTLNISAETAAQFLKKKGETIESDVNAKLTKEQEDMLMKEFATPEILQNIENARVAKAREQEQKEQELKEQAERELREKAEREQRERELREQQEREEEERRKREAEEQERLRREREEAERRAAEEAERLAKEQKQEKSKATEKTTVKPSDDVDVKNNLKVVGKIDLDSINSSTRPPKKTKEELRRENNAKMKEERKRREREQKAKAADQKTQQQPKPQQQPKSQQPKAQQADAKPQDAKPATSFIPTEVPKLQGTKVIGKINLDANNANNANNGKSEGSGKKKKRNRIGGGRVDVNAIQENIQKNAQQRQDPKDKKGKKNKKAAHVAQVSDEDVAKQVKETLARLTEGNKAAKKGAKYRKEKRDAVAQKMQDERVAEAAESKILKLTEFVTANELATMMNITVTQVIQTCFNLGMFVSINQRLDAETINIVADEFGFKTEFVSADVVNAIQEEEDQEEDLQSRPPIVTVMGHVDHGKTSLLDYIRKSNVIAGEAGGITQHIGAYNVTLDDGRHITFLDTPGHEAFTAMRARGAQVTDIAIIIVAADDNVMPQTVEAINHASAAGVPIVFAINKCDKPNANPEKVKESLANMNYLVEDWGGKYQSQDISAKSGKGVQELLEKVLLEAELLDLKANPDRKAQGTIIESSLDKGRGYVATVLVSNGTLNVGDVMLAGTAYGRVKAMFNERNQRIKSAGPAEPVIVLGLNGAPQAGDKFNIFDEDHEAREIAAKREQLAREQGLRTSKHLTLDEIGRRIALGNFQEINVIVKGDVDGSIEALSDSLIKLSTEEIQVNVIHKAVGQISESDIMLAAASNAIIVGFQVRPSLAARKMAEKEEIDIRLYSIIYDAIEEMKDAMAGMLAPEIKEEIVATLEIRETFKISKVGTIAGCMCKEGKIKRTSRIRLIRDGIVVYTGELASLKRMKDDVKEVSSGFECGLNIANYNDIHVGDIVEAFEQVEVKKTL
ncbi:MAG: translation initiation factor IF-2 [Paludibacteraceae bacterium]|nr:translation initiation factor IF-2 [Paludibacteraceae bacterium]